MIPRYNAVTGMYRVLLNGTPLMPHLSRAIQRIVVEQELNTPSSFTIEFAIMGYVQRAPYLPEELLVLNDELFNLFFLGAEIQIEMGVEYLVPVFSGKVTSLEPDFGAKLVLLEVGGYDKMHMLTFGKKRRSFQQMMDSDIVSAVASASSLPVITEPTTTVYPQVTQNNVTDYEFVKSRAERIGFEIGVDEAGFYFRRPRENLAPFVMLTFGRDLISFRANMRALTEGSQVEYRGWDYRTKRPIMSIATKGMENVQPGQPEGLAAPEFTGFDHSSKYAPATPTAVITDSLVDEAEAGELARARYNYFLQQFVTGEGSTEGNPQIRVGSTIKLRGMGPRFSGTYYITSVQHSWDAGVYTTNFGVRRTVV